MPLSDHHFIYSHQWRGWRCTECGYQRHEMDGGPAPPCVHTGQLHSVAHPEPYELEPPRENTDAP